MNKCTLWYLHSLHYVLIFPITKKESMNNWIMRTERRIGDPKQNCHNNLLIYWGNTEKWKTFFLPSWERQRTGQRQLPSILSSCSTACAWKEQKGKRDSSIPGRHFQLKSQCWCDLLKLCFTYLSNHSFGHSTAHPVICAQSFLLPREPLWLCSCGRAGWWGLAGVLWEDHLQV